MLTLKTNLVETLELNKETTKVLSTEAFNALPGWEQRVIVAEDVIEQIKVGRYRAGRGSYLYVNALNVGREDDVKDNFDQISGCRVCALGACLMSITHFKNKLKFNEVTEMEIRSKDSASRELMKGFFSGAQWYLIEKAFERGGNAPVGKAMVTIPGLVFGVKHAVRFGDNYWDDDTRLVAIMQNIIDNEGVFKPWLRKNS